MQTYIYSNDHQDAENDGEDRDCADDVIKIGTAHADLYLFK